MSVDCPSHFLARKNHVIISTAQRERVAKRVRDPLVYITKIEMFFVCVCVSVDCPSHFLASKNYAIISTAQRERVAKRARDPLVIV